MIPINRTLRYLAALCSICVYVFSGISSADVPAKWKAWPPYNTPKTSPETITPEQLNKLQRANQLWEEMQKNYDTSNFDQAIAYAEQALEIRLQIIGLNHKTIPETLITIAQLYEAKGDKRGAAEWYDRGLELQGDSVTVAKWLAHVGELYTILGQPERAEKNYIRALKIFEHESGQNSHNVCAVLAHLGKAYEGQEKNQQAERAYLRSLAIMRQLKGVDHDDNANLLKMLINFYEKKEDMANAADYMGQLLPIYERQYGSDSIDVGILYGHLGSAYFNMGDYKTALRLFKRAYAILKQKLGSNDSQVIQLQKNLEIVEQAINDQSGSDPEVMPDAFKHSHGISAPHDAGKIPDIVLKHQSGHSGSVTSVAFSTDWKLAVTGGEDRVARLWRLEFGVELRSFNGHKDTVNSVSISSNGHFVLTGSEDKTMVLWDAATGKVIRQFENPSQYPLKVVGLSPTGKYALAVSWNGNSWLWEIKSGKRICSIDINRAHPYDFAFSPKEQFLLFADRSDQAVLIELATGKEIKRFPHPSYVNAVAFSPDGTFIATGCGDHIIRLWDLDSGTEKQQLKGHTDRVIALDVSTDNRLLVSGSGSSDGTARIWDLHTGKALMRFDDKNFFQIEFVKFSPNSRYVNISGFNQTARIWDIQTGQEVLRLEGTERQPMQNITFSTDGRQIMTKSYQVAQLWGSKEGQIVLYFQDPMQKEAPAFAIEGHFTEKSGHLYIPDTGEKLSDAVSISQDGKYVLYHGQRTPLLMTGPTASKAIAVSSDGKYVLVGGVIANGILYDVAIGKEARLLGKYTSPIRVAAFSDDGKLAITAGEDKTARIWNRETGDEIQRFIGHENAINCVDISRDGKILLTGSSDGTARLWNVATGNELLRFFKHESVESCALSPDGELVATGSQETIDLWSAKSGKIYHSLADAGSRSAAFSKDSKRIATVGENGKAVLWDTVTGVRVYELNGHSSQVLSAAFWPEGRLLLTGGEDGTIRLWDLRTGRERGRIVVFNNGDWVVTDTCGHFDANNLENVHGVSWVCSDGPFLPLPVEIFMRDYYEPHLLERLLAGEQFKSVRSLLDLSRIQPYVSITKIEQSKDSPEILSVAMEVSAAEGTFQRGGKDVVMKTGVHDLRLYRNGQLVGRWPEAGEMTYKSLNTTSEEELRAWRKATEIKLDNNGKATKTFTVRLPRREDLKEVEFTAYAFNLDRVKSETARQTYKVPAKLKPVLGRAYVITVGVSGNEDMDWGGLTAPAQDAKLIQETLAKKLRGSGKYEKVVPIWLITVPPVSDLDDEETKQERKTFINPTKENIKTVIDMLAGREVDPARLEQIPQELRSELLPVQPEDLVVLSFSSHGVTDANGEFYVLPYNLGTGSGGKVTPELLKRSISSQELSLWLSPLDAEQLVMVVDACHSAAAVEVEGFKPGPMGNPGLGQLSYDKGMPILVATQAMSSAWAGEYSLLTLALAKEGVGEKQLGLMDALKYAEQRVPKLYEEMMGKEEKRKIQEPKLFEFKHQQVRK